MRLAIVGSRNFQQLDAVYDFVESLSQDTHIISGGARGVDSAAERAATERHMNVTSYRPHKDGQSDLYVIRVYENGVYSRTTGRVFSNFGPAAFYRNGLIVDRAQQVVAFWDGESRGTEDSIFRARHAGKPARLWTEEGWTE